MLTLDRCRKKETTKDCLKSRSGFNVFKIIKYNLNTTNILNKANKIQHKCQLCNFNGNFMREAGRIGKNFTSC